MLAGQIYERWPILPTLHEPSAQLMSKALPLHASTFTHTNPRYILALSRLRWLLREDIYPQLEDDANIIYDEAGDMVQHEPVTLALHLHREFVAALGQHQAAWWSDFWAELCYLFERFYISAANLTLVFGHPRFVALLHAHNQV